MRKRRSEVLRIARKRNPVIFPYKLHNKELHVTNAAKYLGVTISKDLNWSPHINNITGKAKNTLRFIKRNIKPAIQKLKKWPLTLMSALSSNTVRPSGIPGKKHFHKKLKVFNGQQHVMYATTTTIQAV